MVEDSRAVRTGRLDPVIPTYAPPPLSIDGSPQLRSTAVAPRDVLSSAGALDAVQPNIQGKQ
jgi:hypothetical protein